MHLPHSVSQLLAHTVTFLAEASQKGGEGNK